MDKSSRQKSKGSINGGGASLNNIPASSTIPSKPPSRTKQPSGKRPSASQYGQNLDSHQCVEEIKNAFTTTISHDAQDPLSAN